MLEWLTGSMVAQTLTASPTLYMLVNATHILSIGLLTGAIIPLDLRLMGFFRNVPVHVIGPFLSRSAMIGVLLAIASGLTLFTVRADKYVQNPAFLAKMGLLCLGIANALFFQTIAPWRQHYDAGTKQLPVRILAGISLVTWISAVIAGRWIGFI